MKKTFDLRLDGKITLLSPLSHIGESVGTDALLAYDLIVDPDGKPVECFTYSGNAFRGMLRDLTAVYLTERLGVRYTLEGFYLLFSGGALGGDQCIDIAEARKIRSLFPALSLFGGGAGQQILPGKVKIGALYPIAAETQRVVPPFLRRENPPSCRMLIYDRSFTRVDDAKNPDMAQYLAEVLNEAKPKKNPQQMRYTVEFVAAGTEFYQRIDLCWLTELELGAFVSGLAEFSRRPFIGGRCGTGCGLVRCEYWWRHPGDAAPAGRFAVVDPDGFEAVWEEAAEALRKYEEFLAGLREKVVKNEIEAPKALGVIRGVLGDGHEALAG